METNKMETSKVEIPKRTPRNRPIVVRVSEEELRLIVEALNKTQDRCLSEFVRTALKQRVERLVQS